MLGVIVCVPNGSDTQRFQFHAFESWHLCVEDFQIRRTFLRAYFLAICHQDAPGPRGKRLYHLCLVCSDPALPPEKCS